MDFFRIFVFSLYILFLQYIFSIESVLEEIDNKRTRNSNNQNDVPPFLVQVIVKEEDPNDDSPIAACGGAFLTKDTFLTTVRCVKQRDDIYEDIHIDSIYIMNNDHSMVEPDIIYVHRDYDQSTSPPSNDIALIKIDGEISFERDFIKINTERLPENTNCTIYSFHQYHKHDDDNMNFKEFNVTVYDTDRNECISRTNNVKGIMCAKRNYSMDADDKHYTGGPIVCLVNNETRLAGVAFDALFENKEQNVGHFTDVSYYQTWIKETNLTSIVDKIHFPNVVIVRYKNRDRCFGTIVAKDTVLTAATCAFDNSGNPCSVDDTILRFVFTEDDLIVSTEHQVTRIEPHEYYNRTTKPPANDIAYFIIEDKFPINEQRIDFMQQEVQDGIPCSVFRWIPRNEKYSSEHKTIHSSISVKAYNHDDCKIKYKNYIKYRIKDFRNEMMCVVMKALVNTGPYQTYYGGPLICRMNDRNHLAGIGSSNGYSYNNWYLKQGTGVFTNVMYYLEWIKDASSNHPINYFNHYPYVVLVKDRKANVSCAGILVQKYLGKDVFIVITAGHCLSSLHEREVYSILIGNVVEWKMKKFDVKKITRHENYDPSANPILNDIAFLEIEKRRVINETGNISNDAVSDNTICQFVGWNRVQTSIHKNELMHTLQNTSAKILNKSLCSTLLNVHVTEGMVCAEVSGDTCEKYSGGILICPPETEYVLGIATYGLKNCSRRTSFPIVFTNIKFYREWVQKQIDPPTTTTTTPTTTTTTTVDPPTTEHSPHSGHWFPRKDYSNNSSTSNTDLNIITKVLLILLILFSVL